MTRVSMVRDFEISMEDNSTLSVCIAIELSTDDDYHLTAMKQMGKLNIVNGLLPIETALTHLLCDPICHQDDPDDEDDESINLFKEDEPNINLEEWTRD
jgi:hypothetical protein